MKMNPIELSSMLMPRHLHTHTKKKKNLKQYLKLYETDIDRG